MLKTEFMYTIILAPSFHARKPVEGVSTIQIDQDAYIHISPFGVPLSGTPDVQIQLEKCFVTNGFGVSHSSYEELVIIENNCPVSNAVDIINVGNNQHAEFKIKTFRWKNTNHGLVIMCKISFCATDDCANCIQNTRKRRSSTIIKEDHQWVYNGPIYVIDIDEVELGSSRSSVSTL